MPDPDPGTRRVSFNESISLLKRAFEGLGHATGACQDAAEMVVWSQACGLDGFGKLQQAWPELEAQGTANPQAVVADGDMTVLDAHGGSVLFAGPVAMDLACSLAADNDLGVVELHRCRHPVFILKCITDCAYRGQDAQACWTRNDGKHLASCEPFAKFPQYGLVQDGGLKNSGPVNLRLTCGSQLDLPEHLKDGPQDLARHHAHAVQEGMEVTEEFWSTLTRCGDRVLVADSEQSRMGAGE